MPSWKTKYWAWCSLSESHPKSKRVPLVSQEQSRTDHGNYISRKGRESSTTIFFWQLRCPFPTVSTNTLGCMLIYGAWLLQTFPSPCSPHHLASATYPWMFWWVNSLSKLSAFIPISDLRTCISACVITGPGHLEQCLCNEGVVFRTNSFFFLVTVTQTCQ